MNYSDVLANARECIGKYCKACPVCNGVACKNQIPGPGAKGVGDTAIRNYNKWADIRVNMDTLCEGGTPDTHVELFGKTFAYPFFAGPVGAVNLHYSEAYTDMTYNDVLVRACAENGIAAFTGDGTNPTVMEMATKAIGAANGCGVPTIKPWNIDTIKEKMAEAKASGCFAVAMDVDAAGLPFLKNMTPPAGSKSVEELAEIVKLAERPFIVKGVMTVRGAQKAAEAGAAAARPEGRQITYTDLYEWGLSGRPGSAERKAKLLNALGLPPRLSKKELVEALNRLYSFEQLNEMQLKILED